MKRITAIIPLLLAALALIAFNGCSKDNAAAASATDKQAPPVTVSTVELKTAEFNEVIDVTGTIASYEDVMVPSDEGGRVLRWMMPLGAHVHAGQVLAQLDSAIDL